MTRTKIFFARTRHEYPSYADFWTLVEIAGFKICYVDQIQLERQAVYITTPWNGETAPALSAAVLVAGRRAAAKVIWWNLERPDVAPPRTFAQVLDEVAPLVHEIWVSDGAYASWDARLRLVTLGSHPALGSPAADRPLYDIAHLSYLWGRRENMIGSLERAGLRIAPGAWTADAKAATLSASRLMLSLHQYPQPPRVIAPIRCAVAAAYRLPFVTEELDSAPTPLTAKDYVSVTPATVVEQVVGLLREPERLDELSWQLFRKLCIEHPFDACVRQAVEA